jgi:hypothetical protein
MSLTTPFSVQKLQTALHAKAKGSPNFRFHALYDYRKDVLAYAYERCQANGGAAGVDSQTFENIEAYGRERWLDELTQELKSRTYHEVEERLARWLLMSQDRLGGARVSLTQEFLAHMLGTRRASVTVAGGILQKAGLIKYTRGELNVVSRVGLGEASCECYQSMVRQSNNWEREWKH